jgi:hypothetical protein
MERVPGEFLISGKIKELWTAIIAEMCELLVLLIPLIATVTRLAKPGGVRTVIAESDMLRHPLLVLNRGRKRAPDLRPVTGSWPVYAWLSFGGRVYSVPLSF